MSAPRNPLSDPWLLGNIPDHGDSLGDDAVAGDDGVGPDDALGADAGAAADEAEGVNQRIGADGGVGFDVGVHAADDRDAGVAKLAVDAVLHDGIHLGELLAVVDAD